ncbi:hypothetical protein VM98_21065 [Streptomyces rubellomurinus subsp. indigoferus]|nr:hypothetical protein VM98_21065 [Streptomyces rubellomurinus subsp. indigoferus]
MTDNSEQITDVEICYLFAVICSGSDRVVQPEFPGCGGQLSGVHPMPPAGPATLAGDSPAENSEEAPDEEEDEDETEQALRSAAAAAITPVATPAR